MDYLPNRYTHTKKRETCFCQFHNLRLSHCLISSNRQREAHAEYKHSPCYFLVKVRVCAYAYTQKAYQNRHKRDNLYPVGHLSLLSPDEILKFARFQVVRTER